MTTKQAFEKWWNELGLDYLDNTETFKKWMLQAFIAGVFYTCDRWEESMNNGNKE